MRKHFLIFALLVLSTTATPCPCQRPNGAGDMASFEAEAVVALNLYCLDVWCEGIFWFDFQSLSCREGKNDMSCTLKLDVWNPVSRNEDGEVTDEELYSITCDLKNLPKMSFPATAQEVDDHVTSGPFRDMVDDVCIMKGVYNNYSPRERHSVFEVRVP